MAISKERKQDLVKTYAELINKSEGMILIEYRGLNMKGMGPLPIRFRNKIDGSTLRQSPMEPRRACTSVTSSGCRNRTKTQRPKSASTSGAVNCLARKPGWECAGMALIIEGKELFVNTTGYVKRPLPPQDLHWRASHSSDPRRCERSVQPRRPHWPAYECESAG